MLDSGSRISFLPDSLANDIFSVFDVQFSQDLQMAFCDCSLADKDITVNFTFTSPTISVPIRELVLDPESTLAQSLVVDEKRQTQNYSYGNAPCLFGITRSGNSYAVLGDTFLRSAYVVYDLANNEISLAQTNFESNTTNIREIGTGSESVPDASSGL